MEQYGIGPAVNVAAASASRPKTEPASWSCSRSSSIAASETVRRPALEPIPGSLPGSLPESTLESIIALVLAPALKSAAAIVLAVSIALASPQSTRKTCASPETPPTAASAADVKKPVVTLAFVGDILLSGTVGDLIRAEGSMAPWQGVEHVLSKADFAVGNLECAVGTKGQPAPGKEWTFRADPASLKGMAAAGIDLLSLANNHTFDYGIECLLETVDEVRRAGVRTAGAGANKKAAREPVIFEKDGVKVGILATNMIYPDVSWAAKEDSPGQAIDSADWHPAILGEIRALAKQVDIVVVYVHWSAERREIPEEWVCPAAKAMREAGAQIVAGSHPHILNGLDYDGRNLTAYSLGNFVFSTRPELPKLQIGAVLEVTVSKDGVESATVIPTKIVWGKTVVAGEPEKADILRWVSSLSSQWDTDVDERGAVLPILFTDLAGHWARPAVTKLALSRTIEGYPDRTFRPDLPISKGEFAALFTRVIAQPEQLTSAPKCEGFSLCQEDSWAYVFLNYLAGQDLISGADTEWSPSRPCSRLDVLGVMKKRAETSPQLAAASASKTAPASPAAPAPATAPASSTAPALPVAPSTPSAPEIPAILHAFTDLAGLSQTSIDIARWAVESRLLNGYDDGTLRLGGAITRGEMAELLLRFKVRHQK